MANDETLYRNEDVQENKEKKSVNESVKVAGAAAVGAAVGSAASMAAQAAINKTDESSEEVAPETADAAENAENEDVQVAAVEEAPTQSEPHVVEHTTEVHHYHNTEVHHHHYHTAQQQSAASQPAQEQPEQVAETPTAETPTEDVADQNVQQANADDVDIHVIGVEHNVDLGGQEVDVAVIEVDGHQGLLVDTTQDGEVNGAIVDFNDDGQVQENEISPDLSDQHIAMPEQSAGDEFMQASNDMPDYTNDAVLM